MQKKRCCECTSLLGATHEAVYDAMPEHGSRRSGGRTRCGARLSKESLPSPVEPLSRLSHVTLMEIVSSHSRPRAARATPVAAIAYTRTGRARPATTHSWRSTWCLQAGRWVREGA